LEKKTSLEDFFFDRATTLFSVVKSSAHIDCQKQKKNKSVGIFFQKLKNTFRFFCETIL